MVNTSTSFSMNWNWNLPSTAIKNSLHLLTRVVKHQCSLTSFVHHMPTRGWPDASFYCGLRTYSNQTRSPRSPIITDCKICPRLFRTPVLSNMFCCCLIKMCIVFFKIFLFAPVNPCFSSGSRRLAPILLKTPKKARHMLSRDCCTYINIIVILHGK